jgi:5-methylcytosine-specific restriction endonuclease McrA
VPISKGGNNTKVNFVVCCESCNNERGEQDFVDYLKIKNKRFKDIKHPFI